MWKEIGNIFTILVLSVVHVQIVLPNMELQICLFVQMYNPGFPGCQYMPVLIPVSETYIIFFRVSNLGLKSRTRF